MDGRHAARRLALDPLVLVHKPHDDDANPTGDHHV
ncbi:hypothetical protein CBM2606_A40144 [Cupriavidus taiwanensis]|nr:hypothetical protein CBM2606_A40144 [Cupriavidus taiwanensis]